MTPRKDGGLTLIVTNMSKTSDTPVKEEEASMSFGDLDTNSAPAASAVATVPSGGNSNTPATIGGDATGLTGEWTMRDVTNPRINVVAKTGGLVDEGFTPGDIVLQKEITIYKRDMASMFAVVLACDKEYQEEMPRDSEEMPRVVKTEAEVLALGGTLDWDTPGIMFRPKADIDLLLRAPSILTDDEQDFFPFEVEGEFYAIVRLTVAKTAFPPSAGEVGQAVAYGGGSPLSHKGWSISTRLRKRESNSWFVPVFKRSSKPSAALIAFIDELRS